MYRFDGVSRRVVAGDLVQRKAGGPVGVGSRGNPAEVEGHVETFVVF